MELNWLQSLVYGFLSGLTEFFPVSADAHRKLYLMFLGAPSAEDGLLFAVHFGCLLAVIVSSMQTIRKMYREKRIASLPKRTRKRVPDPQIVATIRVFRTAAIPLVLGLVGYRFVSDLPDCLWLLALVLFVNGFVLYLPQCFPSANKDGRSLSGWDAFLIGLSGAVAVIPGLSRVGAITSAGVARGADRRYALELSLLLCIPALLVVSVISGVAFLGQIGELEFMAILRYLCTSAAAFATAYLTILVMRFLSFKVGFFGFSYYSWGMSLFVFILYLIL